VGQGDGIKLLGMNIYWFNWPSHIGGADTKFFHLLSLLSAEYKIFVIPNEAYYLDTPWFEEIKKFSIEICLFENLPQQMEGVAIALCNGPFLDKGWAKEMKQRGCRVIWSSEMMWHFPGEAAAIKAGWIDRVLYVSKAQQSILEPGYEQMLGLPVSTPSTDDSDWYGVYQFHEQSLSWVLTGNFIEPKLFPMKEDFWAPTNERPFTIGRLSRADPAKYPDDFPKFYERLGLGEQVRFRVMAWSPALAERWSEHVFDQRWELLEPAEVPTVAFLHSLDLLVYNTSQRFKESWGRAVVEAMLCGVVPLLQKGGGHHLSSLIVDGESGFLCSNNAEFGERARQLKQNPALLKRMAHRARNHAEKHLCDASTHRVWWRKAFAFEGTQDPIL
jgi:glycosyltransferase involved in cell wall biosynthesis